jgi:hypothetical protein
LAYFKACGIFLTIVFIIVFSLGNFISIYSNIWLSKWSDSENKSGNDKIRESKNGANSANGVNGVNGTNSENNANGTDDDSKMFKLTVYILLGVSQCAS